MSKSRLILLAKLLSEFILNISLVRTGDLNNEFMRAREKVIHLIDALGRIGIVVNFSSYFVN